MKNNKRKTTEQFIEEAIKIHKDKYTYEKVVYINSHTKVEITCKNHGSFFQRPSDHLKGLGCSSCKAENLSKRQQYTSDMFIEKSKELYKELSYDYSLVNYINSKTSVTLICPMHGNFSVVPVNHLHRGACCPVCRKIKTADRNMWSYSSWEETGKTSKKFKAFTLYLVEMFNEKNEKFLKLGKTYTSISYRFRNVPYSYNVLYTYYGEANEISKKEEELKNKFKPYFYLPLISFGGKYECFDYKYKKDIIKILTERCNI